MLQMAEGSILFFTTTTGWAACEELWSQAAVDLVKQGFEVSASVSSPVHLRAQNLQAAGIHVAPRPAQYSLWTRAWHYAFVRVKAKWVLELKKLLRKRPPQLVVFSEGTTYPPVELIELCISENVPFVTISHKNWDDQWQSDADAERYRRALRLARRCYFVSEANLHLAEKQIGCDLSNAEVVRNPYNVDFNARPPWPGLDADEQLRLACVARLDPGQKGQDILFETLAAPAWTKRDWHLSLYGDGPVRDSLERLVARFGIPKRITFAGYAASVEEIWVTNHVLVMPSRYEGLPLAMVEAMLCGRPVIATDVAGHSEIIIDGVTGFLAGPPTVASVAQALERLWANRANLEDMGKAGAKRIRELVPADPARVFSEKIKDLIK
jgi:glycosyltransferase involved in cell wall biosynthesis